VCVVCAWQDASDTSCPWTLGLLPVEKQSKRRHPAAILNDSTTTRRLCRNGDVTPPSHVYDVLNDVEITSQSSVPPPPERRCYNLGFWLSRQSGCGLSNGKHVLLRWPFIWLCQVSSDNFIVKGSVDCFFVQCMPIFVNLLLAEACSLTTASMSLSSSSSYRTEWTKQSETVDFVRPVL